MLFWNRWSIKNRPAVFTSTTCSRARHAGCSTALVRTWMYQSETLHLFFFWNQSKIILFQVPQSSSSLAVMRRRALRSRLSLRTGTWCSRWVATCEFCMFRIGQWSSLTKRYSWSSYSKWTCVGKWTVETNLQQGSKSLPWLLQSAAAQHCRNYFLICRSCRVHFCHFIRCTT